MNGAATKRTCGAWIGQACVSLGVAGLVMALTLPVLRAQPVGQKAPQGNPDKGRSIYVASGCSTCHGFEGQGAGGLADVPRLAPPVFSFEAFRAYVRKPSGHFMPGYSKHLLSDQGMMDIYAFLRSRPKPPPVNRIRLLNQ